MSDTFVVCAVVKGEVEKVARAKAFGQLVASLHDANPKDIEVSSNEDGVAILSLPDALGASRAASDLLTRAISASGSGHPIQPLSLSVDGGANPAKLTVSALRLAEDIAENNQIVIAPSIYERLPLLERDTYGAAEQIAGRAVRRRFPNGMDSCFVISPIGAEGSPVRERANLIFDEYVKRGCAELNLRPYRSDQQFSRTVRQAMMASISQAKLVFAYVGGPPWNANVMIEIGYRLASGGAIVLVRDSEADSESKDPLPFDIADIQVLSLPPREPDQAKRDEAIADISRAMTAALDHIPDPWTSHHPFMQVEIDRRGDNHLIKDATREAAALFAVDRRLAGAKVADVVTKLHSFMPEGQFPAFAKEQSDLITELMRIRVFDPSKSSCHVVATVPMVFEGHPNPLYDQRAFLPIIVRYDGSSNEDRLELNVLYLDVTSAVRVSNGVFKCQLEQGDERSPLIWDTYAVSYDRVLPRLSMYRAAVARHLAAMSADTIRTVLDVGSGTGNVTVPLATAGKRLTAVERSPAMVELMTSKLAALPDSQVSIFEQSAESLPFGDARFDGVTILLALFAMDRPSKALGEAIRVLKPGGTLILTEPKECFNLPSLLEHAQAELKENGEFEELETDWRRVISVNRRIDPAIRPKLPAEQIATILKNRGFVDIVRTESHLGNCETISARKSP
jgi:ubiquinone/menaquinone biosynthesis C-methylase UbiE